MALLGALQQLLGSANKVAQANPKTKALLDSASGGARSMYIAAQQPLARLTSQGDARGLLNQGIREGGFTPEFQATINQNTPVVIKASGEMAHYDPTRKQIAFSPNFERYDTGSTNEVGNTVGHEGLHAVYNGKSPQDKSNFLKMVQSSITPGERDFLTRQLAGETYGNYQLPEDLTTVPDYIGTEIHSYLPGFGGMAPDLTDYYKRYFNDPGAQTTARRPSPIPMAPAQAGGTLSVRKPASNSRSLQGSARNPQGRANYSQNQSYQNIQGLGDQDQPAFGQGQAFNQQGNALRRLLGF